jgi:hypothetical protein
MISSYIKSLSLSVCPSVCDHWTHRLRDHWTQREATGKRKVTGGCREKWRRMRSVRASRSRIDVSGPRRTRLFFFFFFLALYCRRRRCCSGHGFGGMVFGTWDLNFRAWKILGYGFPHLGSQLWGLDFHTRGFQDRNLKTFRMWISGCGISILEPGFHIGASHWPSATGTH